METNAATTDAEAVVANPLERRLDLSLAIADVDKDVEQRLKRLSKNMKMPGFRPGKVPAHILRQQYGDEARNEALSESLGRLFSDAVTAQKLRV
ncbi:MAG TPA: trigger factor family protein, partial [Accumulibacter sp.]|nr:trigger factor family protein [Accumulibacter sp.]